MHALRSVVPFLAALVVALAPGSAGADGAWLDGNRATWNVAGAEIPTAPAPPVLGSPDCERAARPPETAEDELVAAQGWRLHGAYQRGWGVILVAGFLAFDAMCRPVPVQRFVFVDGAFAGTLAPEPSFPRTDGALADAGIAEASRVFAVYYRYGPTDPLCCPAGRDVVQFAVQSTPAGPVVSPRRPAGLPPE